MATQVSVAHVLKGTINFIPVYSNSVSHVVIEIDITLRGYECLKYNSIVLDCWLQPTPSLYLSPSR